MKRSCDLEQAKELAAADRLVEFERKRRTAARVNSGGLGSSSHEAKGTQLCITVHLVNYSLICDNE